MTSVVFVATMEADTTRITADKPCLPPFSKRQERDLLTSLLRDVSRSFYLTLRVLPREIRPQVSLAYLLARASDTIADTKTVVREKRIERLREFRMVLCGEGRASSRPLAQKPGLDGARPSNRAEATLLERLGDCVEMFASFSTEDRTRISELLQVIIDGQIFDLERFPGESERELVALQNDDELDRYTYMVAGCVGEFWTRMCKTHLPQLECWSSGAMEELGVRFGKGLQLVNVLRDIPKDLRIGRCYLPVKEPRTLLDPANYDSIRPEYTKWLDRAVEHLDAGWQYTMQIPSDLWRLRLACVWPIWIGLKTIARLRQGNPLDPSHRIKVSRGEVYGLMARSFLVCQSDAALDERYRKLRRTAIP
ncbi:MAG: phytoene/squalene synthase family protein [Verrucomicrobiia bacterium]|jgi:farnesyl-diphosphate farnesyltransferase